MHCRAEFPRWAGHSLRVDYLRGWRGVASFERMNPRPRRGPGFPAVAGRGSRWRRSQIIPSNEARGSVAGDNASADNDAPGCAGE
ncbi:hypothetical protein CNE_BB1p08660 (plasmid) [Cupriavidus necator N-1]|uniref:Uncharacterized protein n=1 Tax=Cupriavidus necator (strain ATCC 43291 / DSM 13513 / CCUG 52238 / LMG 8453 / N-1) TaxID=1042878 RepID=F8GU76_CUPNN|nr:hypothetical protein CNE_BB1p08660 [Cupriavidus necator N-1]